MKKVDVPSQDYAKNHREGIKGGWVPDGTPEPVVRRHVNVPMVCTNKSCPDPRFEADFDEIVRIVLCPSCGSEVNTPQHTWGMP